ncbi:MAG TPA: hypothetical protein VKX17_07075 [Planctomycetota bacterium]|nr:hypothetical protein [Planctomycetota bacterium]
MPDAQFNLESERKILFDELNRQLGARDKIALLSSQVLNDQALILPADRDPADIVLRRTRALWRDLNAQYPSLALSSEEARLSELESRNPKISASDLEKRFSFFNEICAVRRKIALSNPLISFDRIVFAKHAPGQYSHMSDQYYGWWSRPGGGIFVLDDFKSDAPHASCLTSAFANGSFLRPEVSFDGSKILFSYAKYHPGVSGIRDKMDKENVPEDAFYHVFEMNADGSSLRQLTHGRYDDFDARYLPSNDIAFLSTRRGTALQCNKVTAAATLAGNLPDSYVRCGGGQERPVAVYTLHAMNSDGGDLRPLSPFESFEWTPSVTSDGRILYARWDYVDRDNMPYMKLWSCNPDGRNPQIIYGNYTRNPYSTFEPRSAGRSGRIVVTASAHHSVTGGCLVLVDPSAGSDGPAPLKRLTPEVCFPESEGWPATFYNSPYPLSENYYLACWSNLPLQREGRVNAGKGLAICLYDAFGNLEPLYRDAEISCACPIPLVARAKPPELAPQTDWSGPQEGCFLIQNIYEGLTGIPSGAIKKLRIVAMPVKTQPNMNTPRLGVTADDPGKAILGTVPVEADGSAYFRVPSNVSVFFQALDANGQALQTMRSLTYVPPGQTISCVGCHEPKAQAPRSEPVLAAAREASRILPGPDGSWPLRFDRLVQPLLNQHCVACHTTGAQDKLAAKFDLSAEKAYDSLINFGPKGATLRDQIKRAYARGQSLPGECQSSASVLLHLLKENGGHRDVKLSAKEFESLITWMDTYAQKQGVFSAQQERELIELRATWRTLFQAK